MTTASNSGRVPVRASCRTAGTVSMLSSFVWSGPLRSPGAMLPHLVRNVSAICARNARSRLAFACKLLRGPIAAPCHASEVASVGITQPSGEVASDALAWGGFQQWRLLQGTTLFGDRAASAESAAAWRVQSARRLALHRHVPTRALHAWIGHRRSGDQGVRIGVQRTRE